MVNTIARQQLHSVWMKAEFFDVEQTHVEIPGRGATSSWDSFDRRTGPVGSQSPSTSDGINECHRMAKSVTAA